MANPPIGAGIVPGLLKVVRIIFDGVDLGKTTDSTELVFEEDNLDIIFQQDGTRPQDKIPTGSEWMINCTFGELSTTLLDKLIRGTSKSGAGTSMKMGRDLYVSRRETAKTLTVVATDSEGTASTDELQKLNFFLASPEVTGTIAYGADVQRNIAVTFHLFFDETQKTFGYAGYATSLSLLPI